MNRKVVMAIVVVAFSVLLLVSGYVLITMYIADDSWIPKVNGYLEEAKPYPEDTLPPLVLAKVYLIENGKRQFATSIVNDTEFVNYLSGLLSRANIEVDGSISEQRFEEIYARSKAIELSFRMAYEQHSLKHIFNAYFILENNAEMGLEGKVILEQIENGSQFSLWAVSKFG